MSDEATTEKQFLGAYEVIGLESEGGQATVTLKDYEEETYTAHEELIAKMISPIQNETAKSLYELKMAILAMEIEDLLRSPMYDCTLQDVQTITHYMTVGSENNYKECVSRMFDVKNPTQIPLQAIHTVLESYRQ